jgi:hypothetical protein
MKRLRLTMDTYNELIQARDWCARKGFEGMKHWYDEELAFHSRRRALPIGVQPAEEEMDDRRPRRDERR